jgi:hypothetical protein
MGSASKIQPTMDRKYSEKNCICSDPVEFSLAIILQTIQYNNYFHSIYIVLRL